MGGFSNNPPEPEPPRLQLLSPLRSSCGGCERLGLIDITSRLLDHPVSIALKGPSSGGKSFTVESVLKFFPGEAFHALSGGAQGPV